MRTPRSTVGSYSKASCGVRFIRSSCASFACRIPWAASSPCKLFSRFRSEPSTETKILACRRSGDVSTPVIVTKPILGSLSPRTALPRTSFTASLTRRMRSFTRHHDLALDRHQLVLLAVEIPDSLLEQRLEVAVLPRDAGNGQPRALPEVMVIDLGDGCTEAVLQVGLCGLHVLALALQRSRLREVQLDREDADVTVHLPQATNPRSRTGDVNSLRAAASRPRPQRSMTVSTNQPASSRAPSAPRSGRCARPTSSRRPRSRRRP